ncbi:hypothetical protein DPMN_079030 [Dreissena polymorpha]|uniref:Uncharacterized protein n=1 Tax=Dreissena polymorpha TaxID=45954 RepID=A0A9D3YNS9_DREPO|nr:hypothetical protein DPMN_079030 [Dreissena polymorpha]
MHGPITNPGAHLGQTFGVGIRVGLCRAISSLDDLSVEVSSETVNMPGLSSRIFKRRKKPLETIETDK